MYESNTNAVTSALTASSNQVFGGSTLEGIRSLLPTTGSVNVDQITVTGGNTNLGSAQVAFVTPPTTGTINLSGDAKVVVFQGDKGVNVTFGPATSGAPAGAQAAAVQHAAQGTVERVVVGTAQADKIVLADGRNTNVVAGDKDTIVAGEGYDTVVAAQGDSTIVGGNSGHTVVSAAGKEADYTVTVKSGHAIVSNAKTGMDLDITKVQFLQLDNKEALIFASDTKQAEVASLFETMFGRAADSKGLSFWFAEAAKGTSLVNIAKSMAGSTEYTLSTGTDAAFLNAVYHNTFNRAGDTAGLAFWQDKLAHGMSRTEVASWFAHTAAVNLDGTIHTEADIVGSVTVIKGIL
jgi:hypothetical protein